VDLTKEFEIPLLREILEEREDEIAKSAHPALLISFLSRG
jgi:hypothetical protein